MSSDPEGSIPLGILCQQHKSDIVLINLTPDYNGNRLFCKQCNLNKLQNLRYLGDVFRFLTQQEDEYKKIDREFEEMLSTFRIAKSKIINVMNGIEQQILSLKETIEDNKLIKNEDLRKYKFENIQAKELIALGSFLSKNADIDGENIKLKRESLSLEDKEFQNITQKLITKLRNAGDIFTASDFGTQIQKSSLKGYVKKYEYDFQSEIHALQFNKTARYLALGGDQFLEENCFLRVCKINEQAQLTQSQSLFGHQREVKSICFSQTDDSFVTGSVDRTVILWKQDQQFQWIQSKKLEGHQFPVNCVKFNHQENNIASGGGEIIIWNRNQNDWTNIFLVKSSKTVLCLSFSEDDKLLVSGSHKRIVIFECHQDQWRVKQQINVQVSVYVVAFLDSINFISLFQTNSLRYWTLSQDQKYSYKIQQKDESIKAASYCLNKRLLTTSNSNKTKIYSIENDQSKMLIQELQMQSTFTTISNDGIKIAGADKKKLYIYKRNQQT